MLMLALKRGIVRDYACSSSESIDVRTAVRLDVVPVKGAVVDPDSCAKRQAPPERLPRHDSRGSTAHGPGSRDVSHAHVRGELARPPQAGWTGLDRMVRIWATSSRMALGAESRLRAHHSAASSIWARAFGETLISSGELNRTGEGAPGVGPRKRILRARSLQ